MVLSMIPAATAAQFEKTQVWESGRLSDVGENDWFYENVKGVYELGLMLGDDDGNFRPDGSVTMAEAVTIAARLHAVAYGTGAEFSQGSPWYAVYVDYAKENGILTEDVEDFARNATRLQFAHILAKALPESELKAVNEVAEGEIPDVKEDAAVYLLYRAGILTGSDDKGKFYPDSDIKRSETAAIVTRMAMPELRHVEKVEEKPPVITGSSVSLPVPPTPEPEEGVKVSATVEVDENGAVKEQVSVGGAEDEVKASVPAGVTVETGATELTLTVKELEETTGNVTVGATEERTSLDVHMEGVSADNTVPIVVELGKVLPVGLNMGNVALYHVEGENTNAMTRVETLAELDAHNEFFYEPATGFVTVALATFSEITVVSDTVNHWGGEYDYSWYAENPGATEFAIANADQLAGFSAIVGGMNGQTQDSFEGKYIKLLADINLGDAEEANNPDLIFYPIGYYNSDGTYEKTNTAITSGFYAFEGTFDGNGNTIANFYQNTWEMKGDDSYYDKTLQYYNDAMGLFGAVYGGAVKNLTVENFSSDGEYTPTGVIAAYAGGEVTFENIAIVNCNPRVYNTGNGGVVGLNYNSTGGTPDVLTFRNITVDQTNKISALWGSYDVSCGGILGRLRDNSKHTAEQWNHANFENCHVAAIMDVNNDACGNYQYYQHRYAGMLIGTVDYIGEVESVDLEDAVTAENCTVTYGDWNEYWYCELAVNSKASYTHDHQFSRLTKIADVSEIQDEQGNWNTEGNFVLPNADNTAAECYHIFKNSEGSLYQHFHDAADESNPDIYETFDLNGDGELNDLKEDRTCYFIPFGQLCTGYGWGSSPAYEFDGVAYGEMVKSQQKFNTNDVTTYTLGEAMTLGELVSLRVDESRLSRSTLCVFVSPLTENDAANAEVRIDTKDWAAGTVTLKDGTSGAVKVVITDYYYCIPTTLILTPAGQETVEKFSANSVDAKAAYTQVMLGDLFSAEDGVSIGNVTATVTDPNGVETILTGTASDWSTKTIDLTADGQWMVTITDDDHCVPAEVTFTVNKTDKFTKKLDGTEFLYRVGNSNDVPLNALFAEIDADVKVSAADVSVATVSGNVTGTYTPAATWTSGAIQFTGTGVVTVTISAPGANAETLQLEVVNAYNVTTYSGGSYPLSNRNSVLLDDITMPATSFYLSNATLYGNGFTFDVKNGAYAATGSISNNYLVCLNNAVLDNVQIVGAVYTQYGATVSSDYNRPVVLSQGNSTIANSYIANCAAPVRVRDGHLEIIGTTLKGGNFANLDIRGGNVVLDNVTTINQVKGNDPATDGTIVVGLGVVVYYENVLSTTTVTVKNGITQYNHLSKAQANTYIKDTSAKQLTSAMFESAYSAVQYNDGTDVWVNTGIISMTEEVGDANISNVDGYTNASPSMLGTTGYIHTKTPDAAGVAGTAPAFAAFAQGAIAPAYSFDYTTKNYIAKTEGSNDYCYLDGNIVRISMDDGESFNWDPAILTATKNGETLPYTVTMNGVDYTGKTIAFNTADDYAVVYTYTDNNNYTLSNGELATYSVTYEKTVRINVVVAKKNAKSAEFTFGSSATAARKVSIGNNTYVMPDVSATNGTIGSTTVSGTTVYYPIVEMVMSDKKTSHTSAWYAYFPVFSGAVTITDYADSGVGDPVTYDAKTTTMPTGLSVSGDPSSLFKYQSSSPAGTEPAVKDNILVYSSPSISANRSEYNTVITYVYNDNAGGTYYYCIGYHAAEQSYSSICVTPDTRITLADGSQKRIDAVTYEDRLMVWDFVSGAYTAAPASIVKNHGTAEYNVVTLNFEDGTSVKTIGGHGFFDAAAKKFVILGENNAADYVGRSFVKQDGEGNTVTKLVSYSVHTEEIESWSVLTAEHYNCVLEGMLTVTPAEIGCSPDYLMPFAVGEDMKYDAAARQADIETYGLYTYEDFKDACTYEQFVALGLPYFKVAVGKGVLTYEDILFLLDLHMN